MKRALNKLVRWLARRTGPLGGDAAPGIGNGPPAYPSSRPTYAEDGLWTMHLADFLDDPRFRRAYDAGKSTGSWGPGDLRWRVHTILWAAEQGAKLAGDFVECGVHLGGFAQAILDYLDWARHARRCFWLVDTFAGFPPEQRELAAPVHRDDYRGDCWQEVETRFGPVPGVRLIRGAVPEVLDQVRPEKVAFLSIDMNCAEPEVAALEHFWPRLVPGAAVVLDDYAFAEAYRRQKAALDAWAAKTSIPILCLATGQGLIVKP